MRDHPIVRAARFLLGELPRIEPHRRSTALLVFVVSVACLSMLLDLRHPLKGSPFAKDSWTLGVYGALPLVGLVWWELVDRGGKGRWLALAGTVVVVSPLAAHLISDQVTRAFKADPLLLLGPIALGSLLLLASGWRSGARLGPDWGIGLGDWRWWTPRMGVLVGLMIPMVVVAGWLSPSLLEYYPQYKPARTDVWMLVYYQSSLGIYMLGWEFFFRGFLTHGLARRGDALFAIFFQAVPFFLLHRTKPEAELVASFVGSILIAWFCLRARSFLPAWLLHWGMNLTMETTGFVHRQLGG